MKRFTQLMSLLFMAAVTQYSCINDADVVISDSYPNVEDIEYFYFSDIYVKQNWEELNSFLQKKMLQRGFKPV